MNFIKKVIVGVTLAVALTVPKLEAAPGVGQTGLGITNATFAASIGATAAQLGINTTNGTDNLKYNTSCVITFECDTALSNKLATYPMATITLAKVCASLKIDNGNTGTMVWSPTAPLFAGADFAANVGGHICITTNLTDSVIGPYAGIALVNFTNLNSAASISNPVVRIEFKNRISP